MQSMLENTMTFDPTLKISVPKELDILTYKQFETISRVLDVGENILVNKLDSQKTSVPDKMGNPLRFSI